MRGCLVVVATLACRGDQAPPIERLPAPPEIVIDAAVAPPPPPPPRELSNVDPPARVAALVRRENCRVTIGGAPLSPPDAASFLDRLGRKTSWSDGLYGCMSNAPTEIRIACGTVALTLFDSCGNILDASGAQIGTWTREMRRWRPD